MNIEQTIAALERSDNPNWKLMSQYQHDRVLLHVLLAALKDGQEGWQRLRDGHVVVSAINWSGAGMRRVFVLPLSTPTAEHKEGELTKGFPPHPNDSRGDVL